MALKGQIGNVSFTTTFQVFRQKLKNNSRDESQKVKQELGAHIALVRRSEEPRAHIA